jgi:hypothetical protein
MAKNEENCKKNKRLTLDEMYDIFMGDAYKEFREETHLTVETGKNGKRYVGYIFGWFNNDVSPLLYQHIAAEQLLQVPDYKKVDWDSVCLYNPYTYFKLLDLCMNPLVWANALDYKEVVVEGRIAEEDYDSERFVEYHELFKYINIQAVLNFADKFPVCEEDSLDTGYVKGMHYWTTITTDDSDIFGKVLNGAAADFDELLKAKSYDLGMLRANLSLIAEERGGARAAELLRMLQKEWPLIKLWKPHFKTMTEDDIRQFEYGLFHAFDDLLEEWGDKTNTTNEAVPSSSHTVIINGNVGQFNANVEHMNGIKE